MKKNILVIDDDRSILEVVKIILEENGYEVSTISNASFIEKTLQNKLPDLILVDIWMAGYDGRDVTQQLKSQKETSHIPIIVISAHNETQKIAKDAGADGFLEKPFDIEDLLSVVQKHTPQINTPQSLS